MTVSTAITRKQAEAALAAVRTRFASYLTETHLPAEPAQTINGVDFPATRAMTLSPCCPEPTLLDRGDHWSIVWEEGPSEWAYRATSGGTAEDERIMAAEFGATLPDEDPATFPASVYAEPVNHIELGLYPA